MGTSYNYPVYGSLPGIQEVTVHMIHTRLWYSAEINNKILWASHIDYLSL